MLKGKLLLNKNYKSIEKLVEKIVEIVNKEIKKASFDKTYLGVVVSKQKEKTYTIRYMDADRPFTTKYNDSLKAGDTVHVVLPMGSEKNKFLLEDVKRY